MYIICYAASALLAYFAQKATGRKKFWIFSVLCVLLPALLAGLRDYSIGIDTSNYYDMTRYWATASKSASLWEYMAFYIPKGYGEFFFALLVGIMGQIGSFSLFLFVAHVWIMTWVYVGAWRLREHVQPWLVLLLFYLVFFSHSLNVLRQYMALSVAFAFLMDLPQKKYLRYIVAVLIATMFHTSGLLSIGLLIVHWLLYGNVEKLKPGLNPSLRQRQIFIFVAVSVLIVVFNPLVRLLINTGLLHKKYWFYVKNPFKSYNLLATLFLLVEMAAIWLLRKNLKDKKPIFEFFFTLSVVYFLLYQLTAVLTYGKRIAACCAFANLVTLAMLPQGIGNVIDFEVPRWMGRWGGKHVTVFRFPEKLDEKKKQVLKTALVIAGVLVYWLYVYVLRNSSETMPYKFIFQ